MNSRRWCWAALSTPKAFGIWHFTIMRKRCTISKAYFFMFSNWIYFFSQTTSVTRIGGPGGLLKVRVEIDKLGDLKLKISDLFGGRPVIGKLLSNFFFAIQTFSLLLFCQKNIENTADFLINYMWQPGFPFVRPLINDLVSTAFTDIFNESFRHFPIDDYIKWTISKSWLILSEFSIDSVYFVNIYLHNTAHP